MNHARLNQLAVQAPARPVSRFRQLAQRGLTTVEYAIGLLAAATVAIVLIRIFLDNKFTKALFDWILSIFTKTAGSI